jgi:hypothetical protein
MRTNLSAGRIPGVFTFLTFMTLLANAQGQLQVAADLRVRSEYRDGFSAPLKDEDHPAFFIDQRSRLNFDYKQEKVVLRLSVQDVRVWGNQSQLTRNDGALTAFHEGWAQLFFTEAFSLKVGRQEINLDDQRIFGAVDWQMQGRSHDAAMLHYRKGDLEIQGTFAYNQDGVQTTTTFYTVPNNYKAMQYLWAHREFGKFNASILFLNNGKQAGTIDNYTTKFSQTAGTRIGFKHDKFRSNLAFYSQFGKEVDGKTMNASYFAFDFAYQLTPEFSVNPGIELLSGNDFVDPSSSENNAFNPFYGTNHKFNGFMDYFYVGNHINSVGLHDLYFNVEYRKQKFSANANLHLFSSPGAWPDPEDVTKKMDQYLGTELDLTFQYRFSEQVTFDAGYSQFYPTETLGEIKNGTTSLQNWAWFMISFKPILYKTPENPVN